MGQKISCHRDENRAKCLPPQPEAGTANLLSEVANETLVNAEAIHKPYRQRGQVHVVPPCSSGRPRHNLVSARRVSRTSRRPLAVTRKYLLARPPLSAVGSPSVESISPFA